MALSFCSNYPEISSFQQPQSDLLPPELLTFHDDFAFADTFHEDFAFADTCINPLFEPANDSIYSHNYTHLPEIFPPNEFESFYHPKRQNCYEDHHYCSDFRPCFFNGYVNNPNYSTPVPEFLPEFLFPPVYASGSGEENVKKPNGSERVSTQSVAARQRRKKITEKTNELGKLIPGGNKLNTAEMLQAAFKYVKYLQAQVGILEFMGSIQLNEEPYHTEEFPVFIASPLIQEKLYSEEKCLVPEQFVTTLPNDCRLQSNPLILRDINQLIRING
nr:basic helix-loop-helix transcription factor [Loropetalum chinense var. rubrum]